MQEAYIIYIIIACLIVLLYTEWLRPAVSFLLAAVALLVTDILDTREVLDGFANEQLAVIIMLLVISNMISRSGVIDEVFRFLSSKRETSSRTFLVKMMSGVGLSSAFFNNTPLVAMFMPYVHSWCSKNGQSVSKYLIPLSYASILGGCITLVGTSTNLIVNGLAMEYGLPSLELFDFAVVGGIMMLVGLAYLLTVGQSMLPDRASVQDEAAASDRQYFLETHIKPNSKLIGQTVEEAGLRNLRGTFVVEISRGDAALSPVSPKEVLQEGDVLFFAGDVQSIQDITNPELGLSLPKACNLAERQKSNLVEAVVAHNSRLVGKKIQDSDFRGRYDGAILAVHRNGERLWGKIGEIEIRSGDLLLIVTGNDFSTRIKNNPGFYVLSTIEEPDEDKSYWKAYVMIAGLVTALALNVADVPLFTSLSVLLGVGVLLNAASATQIRNSIDFNLLLIIALGLGLGKAMTKTGAADQLINGVGIDGSMSPLIILISLFAVTNLLASIITTAAAVAITLPLAMQIIHETGLPHEPLVLIVAFGGAANFLTPIGYQTNLMVYGPGRYTFTDFFKIGLPLTLVYCLGSSVILAMLYDLM